MQWEPICLICEKKIKIVEAGDDDAAKLPLISGGHIQLTFGYGSRFDASDQYQSAICDQCFAQKIALMNSVKRIKGLIRLVQVRKKFSFSEVELLNPQSGSTS